VAKYFAIIPAMFAAVYPGLDKLNIMRLHSPAIVHPVCRDLQRVDPARAAGRSVPAGRSALHTRGCKRRAWRRACGVSAAQVAGLVDMYKKGRDLGFISEPRVNVPQLNIALDKTYPFPG
jgi:K+-transporting ATPase, c chain